MKKSKPSARNEDVTIVDSEDDSLLSKVTKFSTDESLTRKTKHTVDMFYEMSRSAEQVDENLKNDECLMSVSDKVNKFISPAEKLKSQKSPELVMRQSSCNTATHDVKRHEDISEEESEETAFDENSPSRERQSPINDSTANDVPRTPMKIVDNECNLVEYEKLYQEGNPLSKIPSFGEVSGAN